MWRGNFHSTSAFRGLPFQRYWQSKQPWSWEIRPCGSKGRMLISMIDGEPLHPRRHPMIIKVSPLPRDDFHMFQGKDNALLWRGGWESCHQSLNKVGVSWAPCSSAVTQIQRVLSIGPDSLCTDTHEPEGQGEPTGTQTMLPAMLWEIYCLSSFGLVVSLLANFMEIWHISLAVTLIFGNCLTHLMEKKQRSGICGELPSFLSLSLRK